MILGSGGNGWKSLKEFLTGYQGLIKIAMLPVDWGGSTGIIGRVMEFNNGFLNKKLHGSKSYPVLPFGDMNKVFADFLHDKCADNVIHVADNKPVNVLDFRSDNYDELLEVFVSVKKCIDVDDKIVKGFGEYLQQYLEYYHTVKEEFEYESKTSLGNIWHSYLFFKYNGVKGVCDFYKQRKVLPENLELVLTFDNRQILHGNYLGETKEFCYIKGEDQIDHSFHPIEPESFNLSNIDGLRGGVSDEFISKLKDAELVVIPNGSIANWLPLINVDTVKKELVKKSKKNELVILMNLFFGRNEYPFDVYHYYLKKFGIFPVIFSPKSVPENYYNKFVRRYRLEGKTLNFNMNTVCASELVEFNNGYNNCIEVITSDDDETVAGIKHDQLSLKKQLMRYLIFLYFDNLK